MKNISLILAIAFSLFSFTPPHIDNFVADTKKSSLKWTGSKIVGSSHYGNISIDKGALMMDHGKLVAANFTIDMQTITCTDIENKKSNEKLVSHLNNEDFFDVEKYPTAELKMITSRKISDGKHNVAAEITIKGYKSVINFELETSERNGTITANGKFVFDRTKFNVVYASGTLFPNLGDKIISNDVTIEFNIVANK